MDASTLGISPADGARGSKRPLPRAVFFDLDQTLIQHNEAIPSIAERELRRIAPNSASRAAEFNAALFAAATERWQKVGEATQPADGALRRILSTALLAAELDPALAPELLDAILRATAEATTPTIDAHECLLELKKLGISIGIITNGYTLLQRHKARVHKFLDAVDSFTTSEQAGAHKPDKKIFELALQRLNVPASEAWYVGDNYLKDVCGADAAGLVTVLYTHGRGRDEGPAEGSTSRTAPAYVITRLMQVVYLVKAT
jgi:HAD superfamily hydrolase (TIGR01662 family)